MAAHDIAPWAGCIDRKEAYLLGHRAGRLSVALERTEKPQRPRRAPFVPLTLRIERLLIGSPGMRSSEIARALGIGPNTGPVRSRLQDLRRQGRVTMRVNVWSIPRDLEVQRLLGRIVELEAENARLRLAQIGLYGEETAPDEDGRGP